MKRFYARKIFFFFVFLTLSLFFGCGQKSTQGYLQLFLTANQEFNPNIDHGVVQYYKVTIVSQNQPQPLVQYFRAGTEKAEFLGFPHGDVLQVTIDIVNANGMVVRRGRSQEIVIQKGQILPVEIFVNNVPIFANVKNGATVIHNRFLPKIFAPGEITFQLEDEFSNQVYLLQDEFSQDFSFSISTDIPTSIRPIFIKTLEPGFHGLTVEDPATEERTEIEIQVVAGTNRKVLPTTAGAYVGSMVSFGQNLRSSLWEYHQKLVEYF